MKTQTTTKCKLSLIAKTLENFKNDPSDSNQKEVQDMMDNPHAMATMRELEGIEYFDKLMAAVNNLICK